MHLTNQPALHRQESHGPPTAFAEHGLFSQKLASNVEAAVLRGHVDDDFTPTLPDDLVYLALSNKVELAVRDRLSYLLHQKLGAKRFVVREWPLTDDSTTGRRVDFGVAAAHPIGETPPALLTLTHAFELKSVYSFDIDEESKRKCVELKELAVAVGTIRQERSMHNDAKLFSLLTVTHIECEKEAPALQLVMRSYRARVRNICAVKWDPITRFNPTTRYEEACLEQNVDVPLLLCARDCSSNQKIHGARVSLGYWLYQHSTPSNPRPDQHEG